MEHLTSTPLQVRNLPTRNPLGKRRRKGSVQCLRCDNVINLETDLFYTCSMCALDVCIQCTGISTEMYLKMQDLGDNCFTWTCKGCKQNFQTINNVNVSLQSLDKKNDLRLTSLENKIDHIDSNINNKISEGITKMKKAVIDEVTEIQK